MKNDKTSFGDPRVGHDPPVKKCGIMPLALFRPFCPKLCFSEVNHGPLLGHSSSIFGRRNLF